MKVFVGTHISTCGKCGHERQLDDEELCMPCALMKRIADGLTGTMGTDGELVRVDDESSDLVDDLVLSDDQVEYKPLPRNYTGPGSRVYEYQDAMTVNDKVSAAIEFMEDTLGLRVEPWQAKTLRVIFSGGNA